MNEKNYAEAVKYFGLVTGAEANSAEFLRSYAEASYLAKDDFKSYQIYKQLSVTTPQDPQVFQKLSEIAKKAGTKDEVLIYLKKYVALKPTDKEAQKTLGDMLYESKDAKGSIAAYRAVLKADPAAKGFYSRYAELVMANGTDAEIISALTGAITAGEADVKMYSRLADIYLKQAESITVKKAKDKESKQNLFNNACKMYEKASQLDPKNTSLMTKLADCQTKAGKSSAAILTYEQAIAMNPQCKCRV